MNFESWSDFWAMGRHGAYVWSAYGLTAVVLGLNVFWAVKARRRFFNDAARQLRREKD